MLRPVAMACLLTSVVAVSAIAFAADDDAALADRFALDGAKNIMAEAHFGIINGKLTTTIPYRDAFAVRGLWAPPYVSTNFALNVTLLGKPVSTEHYTWHPFHVDRTGAVDGIQVETVTMLAADSRAGLLAVTLKNTKAEPRTVPVAIATGGTLDRSTSWEFGAPGSQTATKPKLSDGELCLEQGGLAIVLRASKELGWDASKLNAQGPISLPASGTAQFFVAFAVGPAAEAQAACAKVAADPEKAMAEAKTAFAQRVRDLCQKLPTLESDNPALVRFYDRSLVHLLTNRWDVPEFVLHPYYSTGSIGGGCVCDYLWNFGENWEILPLADPAAARTHIKKFLAVDMTKHFAFEPTTGKAFGPWYMVNQEKIIGMIYYYVKNTGDVDFLSDKVDGKTVLEHAILNANYGDNPQKPVALIDYGDSNSHLELRRGLPYNHVMPDLNGRRYENFVMAARLARVAGKPAPQLLRRAEQLKVVLKKQLWNRQTRWFDFEDGKGKKDTRYTVQMFKLFGSKVLDDEEEAGLLAHLNSEKEFLSEFGLHSMSKTDPSYDPADVDNGGPGACTSFMPQVAERLYKADRADSAENIMKRLLWWADRLPYWGDSIVADKMDYRRDTPLQCTIDGAAVAQAIIFGMLGVRAEFNGDIRIHPCPPAFASKMTLKGLKLRGHTLDIAVDGKTYEVREGGNSVQATVGQSVILRGDQMLRQK